MIQQPLDLLGSPSNVPWNLYAPTYFLNAGVIGLPLLPTRLFIDLHPNHMTAFYDVRVVCLRRPEQPRLLKQFPQGAFFDCLAFLEFAAGQFPSSKGIAHHDPASPFMFGGRSGPG